MYKFIAVWLAAVGLTTAACAQQKRSMNTAQTNPKILVACFSATGTTARAAAMLAAVAGGELYAITPSEPYTSADLDWHDRQSRSSVEMRDPASRPAIAAPDIRPADYDVVFLGYPIWWDQAPRVINTFLERCDLRGKTVIPFATSGGSGIARSVAALRAAYPALQWKEGRLLNRADEKVRAAYAASRDGIVVLPCYLPWKNGLYKTDALFVVYPSQRGGWSAQCVTDHRTKKPKLPFPASWAGQSQEVIEARSGLEGISFCHASRFLITAKDKATAVAACRQVLKNNGRL